ncbi:hypothetical protein HY772_09310, partial [Candidatus Woesearchaeota archaeon]|nr:hypothetical protein [Candidatus Woesearchaeota archaeon]
MAECTRTVWAGNEMANDFWGRSLSLDSGCEMVVDKFSIDGEAEVVYIESVKSGVGSPESREITSGTYRVIPGGVRLLKPARLRIKETGKETDYTGIYRYRDSNGWEYIRSEKLDLGSEKWLECEIVEFGDIYAVLKDNRILSAPIIDQNGITTGKAKITISGSGYPNSRVKVINGAAEYEGITDASGVFSVAGVVLNPGDNQIQAITILENGRESPAGEAMITYTPVQISGIVLLLMDKNYINPVGTITSGEYLGIAAAGPDITPEETDYVEAEARSTITDPSWQRVILEEASLGKYRGLVYIGSNGISAQKDGELIEVRIVGSSEIKSVLFRDNTGPATKIAEEITGDAVLTIDNIHLSVDTGGQFVYRLFDGEIDVNEYPYLEFMYRCNETARGDLLVYTGDDNVYVIQFLNDYKDY